MSFFSRLTSRRQFLDLSARCAASLVVLDRTLSGGLQFLGRWSERVPWYRQGPVQTTFNYCDMCMWRCGIVVSTVDGRICKIDGNPADPKSRGRLCARGQAGIAHVYDPDRIKTPLIRTGKRGEGQFRQATWEEALDAAAEGLRGVADKYGGPEAVAFFAHTTGDTWFGDYFPQAFGSPNAAKPAQSVCLQPREVAAELTFGRGFGGHEPTDWDGVRYAVLIGNHVGENAHNTLMQDFAAARARGAKIVVVDPRYSTAAMKADHWLPIKPGTDTALLLAWMNVLIGEGLYDRAYVERYTVGFEQLSAHVQPFTPEWAAAITDLPADDIRAVAREMAAYAPQAVLPPSRHVVWYGNDTQRLRALCILNALLGNYGRPGGFWIQKSPWIDTYPHPPFRVIGASGGCGASEAPAAPPGPDERGRADGFGVKFFKGPTAIQELIEPMLTDQPYPIRGLVVSGMNLLHSIPNVPRTAQALEGLDFVLAVDVLPQEHVAWADVVLPEATYLERYDDLWLCAHKTPYIAMREPAIAPLYDTKPGWWIAAELGRRLDMADFFPWENLEEYLNRRLSSLGLDLDQVRAQNGIIVQPGKPYIADYEQDQTTAFPTPSGKIELYSEALAEAGHDPLPVYTPTEEPPPGYYRLLYGRSPLHTFARTQNNGLLTQVVAENEVWLNTDEAARLGVRHGERVRLENQDGVVSLPVRVKVTARIRRDAVYLVHGFGHTNPGLHRAAGQGASANALQTRYALDPISGGAGLRVNFVRIVKEAQA